MIRWSIFAVLVAASALGTSAQADGRATSTGKDQTPAPVRLGGVGTGWIEWLGADGFGRIAVTDDRSHPAPPQPGTFMALWTDAGGTLSARVLASRSAYGLPCAERVASAEARYPFARVTWSSPDMPVAMSMRAFSPLVPHDVASSTVPVVVIQFQVRNVSRATVRASVALSWQSTLGVGGAPGLGPFANRSRVKATIMPVSGSAAGVRFDGPELADEPVQDLRIYNARGSQTVMAAYPTPEAEIASATWNARDHAPSWWKRFSAEGTVDGQAGPGDEATVHPACVVAVRLDLRAGEARDIAFALAWHCPRAYEADGSEVALPCSTRFADAVAVARYALEDRTALAALSEEWQTWLDRSVAGRSAIADLSQELENAVTLATWRARPAGPNDGANLALLDADPRNATALPSPPVRQRMQQALLALFPEIDAADLDWRLDRVTESDVAGAEECALLLAAHWRAVADRGWLDDVWPRIKKSLLPALEGKEGRSLAAARRSLLDLAVTMNDTEAAELLAAPGFSEGQRQINAAEAGSANGAWARWQQTMGCSYERPKMELRLAPVVGGSVVRLAGPVFMPACWAWCDWRQRPLITAVEFHVDRMVPCARIGPAAQRRKAGGEPFEVRRIVLQPPRRQVQGNVRVFLNKGPVAYSARFEPDGQVEIVFDEPIRLGAGDRLLLEVLREGMSEASPP
jgi:hypothetical protein